jgi:ketosteroid isomerase-like protein
VRQRSNAAAIAALAVLIACAPTLRQGTDSDADVLQTQRQRFEAMVQNDVATLASLLSDDLSYTHTSGLTETKAQFLETLRSGRLRYLSIRPRDLVVRHRGETAIVTGQSAMRTRTAGGENAFAIRFLEVYVRDPTGWRLAAWQALRLP